MVQLELSIPKSVDIILHGNWHALTLRSKGQGHRIIKCAMCVGLQVDTTAFLVLNIGLYDCVQHN